MGMAAPDEVPETPVQPATVSRQTTPIQVGIIGLDAHAVPWTQIVSDPNASPPLNELKVVAAYPAFSPDIPFSADHIAANTEAMRALGVEICDSIPALVAQVDLVLLLSIDGRPHLQQAMAVFRAGKPVFVDKPVAASLAEVVRLFDLAQQYQIPCFSNSSLRYSPGIAAVRNDPKFAGVLGCEAYSSNVSILPGHPDLFYYGIHGCEILFTIMGPGCQTVTRVVSATADLVAGVWADGRVGTFRGILQGKTGFGATVFGRQAIAPAGEFEGYQPLLVEIAQFFRTGKAPISVEETLEIYAFLEAADESKRQGGRPVAVAEVLETARRQARASQRPEEI
jgi:hypothetical protein